MATVLAPPRFEDIISDAEMYFASQSARASDFNPGSVVRTILEVVAQIQERRDIAVWSSLDRAIDEAVFDAWGFPRQEAQPTTGQITLYPQVGYTSPFIVHQGDLFRVPDSTNLIYEAVSYAPNSDGTVGWNTGTSTPTVWISNPNISASTLNVRAVQAGAQANVGARLVTQSVQTIPGIAEIKNLQAFTNGKDASTEADRRAAFTAYIQALPRGTVDALKYGAKTTRLVDAFGLVTEQVRKVALVEGTVAGVSGLILPDTTTLATLNLGHVALFIHNGAGSPTTTLLSKCQDILNGYIDETGTRQAGWRAAGIDTHVYAASLLPQNITINATVAKGYQPTQVAQLIILAIQNVFNILDVGETLRSSDLMMFIKLVPGVLDVTTLTPSSAVTPAVNQLVVLNSITGVATLADSSASTAIQYPTSLS